MEGRPRKRRQPPQQQWPALCQAGRGTGSHLKATSETQCHVLQPITHPLHVHAPTHTACTRTCAAGKLSPYELISECNLFEQHVLLTLQSLFSVHQLVATLEGGGEGGREGGREEESLACVVSHTPPPPTFTYRLLSL